VKNNSSMNQIIKDRTEEIIRLCVKYNVRNLYAFGSVCNSNFNDLSDIDLLVAFDKNISIEKYTDNYFELHYQLEQIFKRKIDLITDNSLSNPYLIKSIDQSKQLIYAD
jgi:uncharacterized protein